MKKRWLLVLGLFAVLGAVAAACGSGRSATDTAKDAANSAATKAATVADKASTTLAGAATQVTSGGGSNVESTKSTVNVDLKEFTISLDKNSAASGQVTFHANNKGVIPHELKVIQTDLPPEALPIGDGKVDEGKVKIAGTIKEFDANKSQDGTFSLTPGKYVVICNVPGHYQGGMHTAFTVQ